MFLQTREYWGCFEQKEGRCKQKLQKDNQLQRQQKYGISTILFGVYKKIWKNRKFN
jgi:hypothetical protein